MNFLNNTFVTLESPVLSSDRVIFVKKFIGNLGENFPLSAVLQESDSAGTIIKREIIRITSKNDTMLNVERAVEPCPQSDTAERPSQNPLNFSENAVIIHTLTAGDLGKILWKITDIQSGKSQKTLNSYSRQFWVKFWTLKGEASRLNIKMMGGAWFSANKNWETGTNEIQLTIGNNNHERNCSWYWKNEFSSSIIDKVRVKKISPHEWEIYAYINAWTHKSFVDISYSGEFIENFQQDISVEDVSGNKIYDIPKYNNDMNIGALQEITEPTNIYDFFPLKEYSGGNKKVTLESLGRWILSNILKKGTLYRMENGGSSWTSQAVAVPRGALVTVGSIYNGSYRTNFNINIEISKDGNSWESYYPAQWGMSFAMSVMVPPGFVRANYYGDWATTILTVQAF